MKRTGVIGLGDMGSGLAKNLIETAYPDGYQEIRDGYLGHVHIKDVVVDTPRSHLEVREMGRASWPISSRRWPKPYAATATTAWSPSRASTTPATEISKPASAVVSGRFRRCLEERDEGFSRSRADYEPRLPNVLAVGISGDLVVDEVVQRPAVVGNLHGAIGAFDYSDLDRLQHYLRPI